MTSISEILARKREAEAVARRLNRLVEADEQREEIELIESLMKGAARYEVLRRHAVPARVSLSMGVRFTPILKPETLDERIDSLCDAHLSKSNGDKN